MASRPDLGLKDQPIIVHTNATFVTLRLRNTVTM